MLTKVNIKKYINNIFGFFGYQVTKNDPYAFISNLNLHFACVVDVGVADGTPALWKKINPQAHVHLVDPNMSQASLKAALKKYMFEYSFHIVALAADSDKNLNMQDLGRASRIVDKPNENSVSIPCKKLDDLGITFQNKTNDQLNLIKIDVEGYELEVLRGSISSLFYIDIVVVEIGILYHQNDIFSDLYEFMINNSFKLVSCLDAPNNKVGVPGTIDLLFVKETSPCLPLLFDELKALVT